MKKKMVTYIVVIIILLLAITAINIFVSIYTGKVEIGFDENGKLEIVIDDTDGEMDSYEQTIEATKTTYPTDIFIYGDDCKLRKSAKFISINELTENSLESDKNYKVIILNDMYEPLKLKEEEFEVLKNYVTNGDYALFYIGNQYTDKFVEKGIIKGDLREGAFGFSIRHSKGVTIESSGLWDEEAQGYYESGSDELLGQCIFIFIEDVIRET